MRPWTESLRGEVLLRAGRPTEAERVFADAHTLAEVLDDSCWIALSGRGLASARAQLGDPVGAASALRDICATLVADADVCGWIELRVRDTFCQVSATYDEPSAIAESHLLCGRADRLGLGEYSVRAARYRARLGDPGAAQEQRRRAERCDNPALLRR